MKSWEELDKNSPSWIFEMQELLAPVSTVIQAVGQDDPAFSFVGHDAANRRIFVARTVEPSTTSEDDYRAVVPDWVSVEFSTAVVSAAQRAHLAEFVEASQAWLAARGLNLQGWGGTGMGERGSFNGGPFEIMFDGPGDIDDEVRDRFLVYGPDTVIFTRGRAHPLM